MAGSVTGNIGSENVTLRNMATEDTLEAILEVLSKNKLIDKDGEQGIKDRGKKVVQAAEATVKSFTAVKEIFSGLGQGAVKIVRGLESNIDNVSFTFSTVAGQLQREGSGLAKLFGFAAESVAQLQEQQNAFSQMIRVGGTVASEFEILGQQASALGTNVRGLADLTDKFAFSLKIGSTSVAGGLKRLRDATTGMSDDVVKEFGRLGIAPQKISEQLLLAAEATGGFGDVLARYGGDTEKFGKGMLKSTQELNIFASAIGSNSRMMQEESAKAAQKIGNRIFLKTLTDGEQKAVQFMQAFTGSGEGAIEVMRSLKGQATSEQAALFQSLKGFTGMGNQIETFMQMVSGGADTFDALTKSGLMEFAKNLSDSDLAKLEAQAYAMRKAGAENEAALLDQQFLLLKGLKDSKPEDLKKRITELKGGLGDGKALDSFTMLQQNQVKLANTTASLNKQMNRLGLALATSTLKGTNLGLSGLAKGGDAAKSFFNDLLKRYGIDAEIPKELLEGPVDKIEEWVDKLINVKLSETTASSSNTGGTNTSGTNTGGRSNLVGTTISGSLIGLNDQITYKDKSGKIVKATLNELINNPSLLAGSESFKGNNNRAETLALGAALQKNITTLSAITAGDDNHEKHQKGAHPAGRGLDFAVNTIGKDPKVAYEQTEAAIKNYMENVLGLKKGEYFIKNELDYKKTGGTGPHMHVEFSESASTKLREKFKMEMSPKAEVQQQSGSNTEVAQGTVTDTGAKNNNGAVSGTVNNNVSVISLNKPDWLDPALAEATRESKILLGNLKTAFDNLSDELSRSTRK